MRIDEVQFAAIYDQFAPKIFAYCYFRVSSREEAEDLASQVFLRAWDHLASGRRVTNVPGFLYRIASNLVVDFYRRRGNKREVSLDDPRTASDIPDAIDVPGEFDRDLTIKSVREKIHQLPDPYREVVVMKYINDLTVHEIAEVLGISENNVSVRLHRAIEKLRRLAGSEPRPEASGLQ